MNNDISNQLQKQVADAFDKKTPLCISAGGSKLFYGNAVTGDTLDVSEHAGILEYQASELVLTARCGTKISDVVAALKANNQMLAFEPPAHSADTTFGGAIAAGLSGPRRAFSGAARDFVLGTRIINGRGETLKFGGQVMKNVAGYDASRLMVGAQGTLGVLLDISVKVLPIPESETTLSLHCDEHSANTKLHEWVQLGHPVSASCYFDNTLYVRLGSTENSVKHAARKIGGEPVDNNIWTLLRDQSHEFFKQPDLWRVSLPAATKNIINAPQIIEWAGALRWIISEQPLFDIAKQHGGHATRYAISQPYNDDCFAPLNDSIRALHKRIKQSFDPENILNPGRIYKEL